MFQCVRCCCWIKTAKGLKSIFIMNLNDISDECVKISSFICVSAVSLEKKPETFQTTKVLVDTHAKALTWIGSIFIIVFFYFDS